MELEHLLHCDGIWLHALRYTGPPVAPPAPNAVTMSSSVQAAPTVTSAGASVSASDSTAEIAANSSAAASCVGKSGRRWSFQAPYPSWAAPFKLAN